MILYVDESEDDRYFVVVGLLVESKKELYSSYYKFKKQVHNMNLKPKAKEKIFNEFKSTILDKNYRLIKIRMLKQIMKLKNISIYTSYFEKDCLFNQEKKKLFIFRC